MSDFQDSFNMLGSEVTRSIRDTQQRSEIAQKQSQDIARLTEVTEKQSQEIERLVKVTEKQGEGSINLNKWSLRFAILAVLFAGGAVIFSFLDYRGDKKWQTKQISVLMEIKDTIIPITAEDEPSTGSEFNNAPETVQSTEIINSGETDDSQ